MEKFINRGLCIENVNEFECKCSDDLFDEFSDFTFTIDDTEHTMKSKELFIKNQENRCTFTIGRNYVNGNEWVIGTMFYKKYFTVFDYDAKEIVFYSDTQLRHRKNYSTTISTGDSNRAVIALMKVTIVLVTINIFVLIIVRIVSK